MSYNPERSSALANKKRNEAMATATVKTHRWTREEYERLGEQGFLDDARVELIEGTLYEMAPQNSRHATAIWAIDEALRSILPSGYFLRCQLPLALGTHSQPEPDMAVIPGNGRDYRDRHPTTAVLVVEVAESSAFHDRERKRTVYAEGGIPEYWIVSVADNRLEVYRDLEEGAYQTRRVLGPGETIEPLFAPQAKIRVADLLP